MKDNSQMLEVANKKLIYGGNVVRDILTKRSGRQKKRPTLLKTEIYHTNTFIFYFSSSMSAYYSISVENPTWLDTIWIKIFVPFYLTCYELRQIKAYDTNNQQHIHYEAESVIKENVTVDILKWTLDSTLCFIITCWSVSPWDTGWVESPRSPWKRKAKMKYLTSTSKNE